MQSRAVRFVSIVGFAVGCWLACAATARALPAPGPLRFIDPTPAENAHIAIGSVNVALDAACTFDPNTLAVTLNGSPVAAAGFLPFSACVDGRKTSQTVNVAVSLPNGTISSGPTSLTAGQTGNFSGSGSGDALEWNFDGAAPPTTGSPVSGVFNAAGTFTVRLRATRAQGLAASGLSGGNLVSATRNFKGSDPTPDTRAVAVAMPADLDFANFESSHVHPLALSAAGDELYAVNTPEGRLSIFDVALGGGLTFAGDVPVGVDPVSLAQRPGTNEVWVVNHLSDSVSVVDVALHQVVATIAVGDEPTDIAFASGRAFVSLAGNEDRVKVYNAATRAQIVSLNIFGDDPRALAVNAAGTEVYAVVLESGNQTTALFHELVTNGGGPPAPNPPRAPGLGPAPAVGLIVKFNPANNRWEDESGKNWSSKVNFTLPDSDLFVIDADAATPSVTGTVSRVGTILYDVAARPGSSELWVPNTDARNLVRFEPNLRGHLVATRVAKVTLPSTVSQVDLNPHINYATTPGSATEIDNSISQPGDGVFNAAGTVYYLTAFGSRKVGVLNGAGAVTGLIDVGGGPSGVALNEADARLYVMNRFENTISIVDTNASAQIGLIGVAGPAQFDPSPDVIKTGRKFLYDAQLTSGHGDTACATCHIFGNFDNIAWDLGDPQGSFVDYADAPWVTFAPIGPSTDGFDPMKGPMTTQSLRGLLAMEPFHWRGDRQNFQHFNGAFAALMGREGLCSVSVTTCERNSDCPSGQSCLGLAVGDMQAYTDFIETVKYPPNPFRNADNTMPNAITVPSQNGGGQTATGNPNNGANVYVNQLLDAGVFSCNTCHALPTGTTNNLFNGNLDGESQDLKIPHLRNMYEKVGFDVIRPNLQSGNGANIGLAQQKRGYGFIHDGSLSLTEFLAAPVFNSSTQQERDLFAFMLAFGTETAPAVGRQVTVDSTNKSNAAVIASINTLIAQAEAGRCDVVVKGVVGGVAKGFVYDTASNLFAPDSVAEAAQAESALRAGVGGSDVITYIGVPFGAGVRLGIDRDRDTFLDRTEVTLGYDPADPNSNAWEFQ